MTSYKKSSYSFFIIVFLFLIYLAVVVKTAWLSDDAYISFRVVDNFINGYGLRWNVAERVQAFTNPLWTLFISVFYFFTHEIYFTAIFISIAISLLAVGIVVFNRKIISNVYGATLILLVFIFSKAFTDYSTSGLENPLIYLCLAGFMAVLFSGELNLKKFFLLSLIAGLGVFNRMDNLLFYFPTLAYLWWFFGKKEGLFKTAGILILGFSPFILWEIFSLVYYGFPFPNTAYAKLGSAFPLREVLGHGLAYFEESLKKDFITLPIIFAGVVVSIWKRKNPYLMTLGLGIAIYLLYIVKVGGDFMSGRFFTGALFISAVLLAQGLNKKSKELMGWLIGIVLFLGFISPNVPLLSDKDYNITEISPTGIADERGFYFAETGLLNNYPIKTIEQSSMANDGKEAKNTNLKAVFNGFVGVFGFEVGPAVYVIDFHALADSFLAHANLARYNPDWRSGHIEHVIPLGYEKSIFATESQIEDPNLRELQNVLNVITRGTIWDKNRLLTILKYNLGFYKNLEEPADSANFHYMDSAHLLGYIMVNEYFGHDSTVTPETDIWDNYSTGWPPAVYNKNAPWVESLFNYYSAQATP